MSQKFPVSHCVDDCPGNIWEEMMTFHSGGAFLDSAVKELSKEK